MLISFYPCRKRGSVPLGRPLCMGIAIDKFFYLVIIVRKQQKAMIKKNRSNMESDFVLPCYKFCITIFMSGTVAVRRYPSSKVRSSCCALLEQP